MQCRNGALLLPSLYPPTRHFIFSRSCSKLFVGGLCYDTNETILRDAFQQHGDILEAKVICDRVTGKSKGYGFVKFNSDTAASSAIKEMNSQLLDGRNIRIQFAHKG